MRLTLWLVAALALLSVPASAQIGPDDLGQVITSVTYNWEDISTVGAPLADDAVALPWTFSFYEEDYDEFWVGPRGISFSDPVALNPPQCIDLAEDGDGVILPLWHELVLGDGVIRGAEVSGPDRYVISFDGVQQVGHPEPMSFQVQLFTDGAIEMHYQDLTVDPVQTWANGGAGATRGFRDPSGLHGSLTLECGVTSPDSYAVRLAVCPDDDGDGFCAPVDCDDSAAAVNPDATEVCDGVDDDCDPATQPPEGADIDTDNDGFLDCEECGPSLDSVFPGAPEICDGVDNDCDGVVPADEVDADGDLFRLCVDCDDTRESVNPDVWDEGCDGYDTNCDGTIPPEELDTDGDGFWPCAGDCDDDDPLARPGREEECDGVDNDCIGGANFGVGEGDVDGDGFLACDDCDDARAGVHRGATEICDGLDNDCDRWTDEGIDRDGDGATICDGDCDDDDPDRSPDFVEECDNRDHDCTGVAFDLDADGDGATGCGLDCDDANLWVFPGAEQLCDGMDNDCEALPPEANDVNGDGFPDDEVDADGDGYLPCGGDCDDEDPEVVPEDCVEAPTPADVDDDDDDDDGGDDDDEAECGGCSVVDSAGLFPWLLLPLWAAFRRR